jgi:hypothetical protein
MGSVLLDLAKSDHNTRDGTAAELEQEVAERAGLSQSGA